jgi:type IV secretion system protein VirB9
VSPRQTAHQLAYAAILFAATPWAVAEKLPARGAIDPRVRSAPYSSEQVYRLYGYVGYQIDLEFERGETYLGIGGGDLEGLTIGALDNHVILKPKAANVGTNLTIFTDRRHYQFLYSASTRRPDEERDEIMYAVRFSYPSPPATTGPTPAQRIEDKLYTASAQRPQNFNYWYCGRPNLKPIAASDDGVQTRLTFAASAELPAIFVRNDDGTESLLNFNMQDGNIVIHRVAQRFVLRRGHLTGCLVNKGFIGAGDRLDSGTIAPDVERQRIQP